jgi:primary-amine oxidase
MRFPVLLAACALSAAVAQEPPHVLDPLTAAEITRAVTVLHQSGRLTDQARFGTITVQPRPKTGNPTRAARLLGFDWTTNAAFVAVVDLAASRVESFVVVDSEPPMRLITIRRAEEAAHADPRWVAALTARGIDTARVSVLVGLGERQRISSGAGGDRFVSGTTWLRDGVPGSDLTVSGLSINVNLTKGTLQGFNDGQIPMGARDSSAIKARATTRPALAPLTVTQSAGSSARIAGNVITWDRWRLRVGVDPRRGLEVHDVAWIDGARRRPVLYSGSVSEIIAPYGDASFGTWYPRDEGDYGMGIYSQSSAVPLNDAPANTTFLPATMHDARGRPVTVPRAIAVYERDAGMLWRHANVSVRGRQLVVSGHSTIDNYDYQFNWIFGQDGEIQAEVVLSGIMNTGGGSRAGEHGAFGHVVAPSVNAPNHQHFFSYRLDLDVDGPANSVFAMETAAPPSGANPKGELFGTREVLLDAEQNAIADVSFNATRTWRVVNPHETNALGDHTSYAIVPGAATPAYPLAASAPMRTAGYIAHQLWVTPFAPDEVYAAGEFQNLGRDGDGLPTWTKRNRPLADTDVVLWYTLGITHIPRPEDWPYMPAHRGSVRLVPVSFFTRNPALDLPSSR